jgi:hypothetical protein
VFATPPPAIHASAVQDSPVVVNLTPRRGTTKLLCSVDHKRARTCGRRARFKLRPGRHVVTAWAVAHRRASRKVTVQIVVPRPAPPAVSVGGAPVGVGALGATVWVSGGSSGEVVRVDSQSRAVESRIAVGGQLGGIAATAQAVWVSVFDGGAVARIDPANDTVVSRTAVGGQPTEIAVGAGAVWIGNLDGYVSRVDPTTGLETARIGLPSGASSLLPAAGLVWVGLQDGSLVSIDPATNVLSGQPIRISTDVDALAESPAGLWVCTFDGIAALVDPSSRMVANRVKLPGRASGIAFANGVAWVSLYDRRLVLELGPGFVGAVHTGAQPRESIVFGSQLWVVDQASGQLTPIPL